MCCIGDHVGVGRVEDFFITYILGSLRGRHSKITFVIQWARESTGRILVHWGRGWRWEAWTFRLARVAIEWRAGSATWRDRNLGLFFSRSRQSSMQSMNLGLLRYGDFKYGEELLTW
jgi:hypothetical protein